MMTAVLIALAALPLVVLRRSTLAAYYVTAAMTWLFALLLRRRVPSFDAELGFTAVAAITLAILGLFIARGSHVVWSPNRGALIAALIYALAIPAMLRAPIDGDEPYYLLVTESLARDGDVDLANQYRDLAHTASGRTDLAPQTGDRRGAHGEQYSRHEPFLPLLMVPGYWLGGLHGALATIALFGVLLVRSTLRWMEDEGIPDAHARAVFALFALGPPLLFFSARIWPEVPAAFFFVETLRGLREERTKRWLPSLLLMVLLKLRFGLVAIGCIAVWLAGSRKRLRPALIALALLAIPVAFVARTTVHTWRELIPSSPRLYAIGFAGLIADGMSGIAFQAPFYLLGLFALTRWRSLPRGVRAGLVASLPYVVYLLPRGEWFGGWAPPLRYIAFLTPLLAVAAASVWDRIGGGAIALVAAMTVAIDIHGVRYPWRLFHPANGENAVGDWFSERYLSDFSRLFPSFIRLNHAAWIGAAAVVLAIVLLVRRGALDLVIPAAALALASGFTLARQPASRVELEDAHVTHDGGRLYPDLYVAYRVGYRGGWILEGGDALTFLARRGDWTLHYITGLGARFELAGRIYSVPPGDRYATIRVAIPQSGPATLRCIDGAINVDRMDQ
ncbi:MAG TPA: hypothetical protein VF824_01095 [Thermoanaerobaculia bacterium]|jgi:hypothetical protein